MNANISDVARASSSRLFRVFPVSHVAAMQRRLTPVTLSVTECASFSCWSLWLLLLVSSHPQLLLEHC